MARTHVITGSSSGIGAATAKRLTGKGHRVIGVDIRDAEVIADLSTPEGRAEMVEDVCRLTPDGIDGILTSAGVSTGATGAAVVSTNYFGTIATLEGLLPYLRKPGARCVSVSSVGMLESNDKTRALEEACLLGDEASAIKIGEDIGYMEAYPGTKNALSVWSRRTAVKPEWAGAGVSLNIIAPGVILTPMTKRAQSDPEVWAKIQRATPCPVGQYAEADDIAELIDFLMNVKTNHLIGQLVFFDSGSEASMRPSF